MPHELTPKYIPWLFDNRSAWEAAIHDERYRYDMPFENFMQLYKGYRSGIANQPHKLVHTELRLAPKKPKTFQPPKVEEKSVLLDQADIDALIAQMSGLR
jgi:hypothetical protein